MLLLSQTFEVGGFLTICPQNYPVFVDHIQVLPDTLIQEWSSREDKIITLLSSLKNMCDIDAMPWENRAQVVRDVMLWHAARDWKYSQQTWWDPPIKKDSFDAIVGDMKEKIENKQPPLTHKQERKNRLDEECLKLKAGLDEMFNHVLRVVCTNVALYNYLYPRVRKLKMQYKIVFHKKLSGVAWLEKHIKKQVDGIWDKMLSSGLVVPQEGFDRDHYKETVLDRIAASVKIAPGCGSMSKNLEYVICPITKQPHNPLSMFCPSCKQEAAVMSVSMDPAENSDIIADPSDLLQKLS